SRRKVPVVDGEVMARKVAAMTLGRAAATRVPARLSGPAAATLPPCLPAPPRRLARNSGTGRRRRPSATASQATWPSGAAMLVPVPLPSCFGHPADVDGGLDQPSPPSG